MDETDDALELLTRGGHRISATRQLCASSNEKRSYGKHNECTRYHLNLFHNNACEIIEHYPIRIMISKSNIFCNFKLMSHRVARRQRKPYTINEKKCSCKHCVINYSSY